VTDPANPGQQYGGHNPYNPQGGNPYDPQGGTPQGGSPYGAPSAGPYGQQGGSNPYQPQGGEAPAPPPYGAPAPPPPPKKSFVGRLVGGLVSIVIIVIVALGWVWFKGNVINDKSDTVNAKVGDCIHSEELSSTTAKEVKNSKILKCDDAAANYKVVGVVSGKTETQFNVDSAICAAYPTAESALWKGQAGRAGSVLCLEPNKK
jgi:hypothetical protein